MSNNVVVGDDDGSGDGGCVGAAVWLLSLLQDVC